MTVAELTERELISRVRHQLPPAPPWLIVGIGDDAAVAEPVRNQLEVLTVDAIVDGVHFDRRFTPAAAIGHRALAVNLSDLAAMGAAPRMALLSMALPSDLECEDFDAMVAGLATLASTHRVHVVGGNLTRTPGPLTVDVTAFGNAKRRQVLTRAGARANDEVYVTGALGAAGAGLRFLLDGSPETALDMTGCVERYHYPSPRVRAGLLIGRNRAASACMDLSDGLADGVRQISEASGIGMTIDADALPIDPVARAWFDASRESPVRQTLTAGDDYELLITAAPKQRRRLHAAARTAGVTLTRIGVCTKEPALLIRSADPSLASGEFPQGFSHFR